MFLDLKANNAYVEGKKQVGEQVEKSPEPRKYHLYHFKYFVGNFTQYTTQVPGIKWDAYLIENFALQDYDKLKALRAHRLSYLLR